MMLVILLLGYSKDVRKVIAHNEILIMKMVRLIKRAFKRILGVERLWKIQPLNNEELSYVTYFDSLFFLFR